MSTRASLMVFDTCDGDRLLVEARYDEPEPDWNAVENDEAA
jgi:hypothetical protein